MAADRGNLFEILRGIVASLYRRVCFVLADRPCVSNYVHDMFCLKCSSLCRKRFEIVWPDIWS